MNKKPVFSNKVYDILKWVTLILLPSLATFYIALGSVWNLPYPNEVARTIAAIDLFLAMLLGISINRFNTMNPLYRAHIANIVGGIRGGSWILTENMYAMLTWVAQILLPALATLYGALALIWPLPYSNEIVATLVAIDALLGALLGFTTAQFHKLVSIKLMDAKH